jgi:hypothetical protein
MIWKPAVWEMDDLIVYHYSKRHFSEYEPEMLDIVNFWLRVQENKGLESDFGGDLENIDTETWRKVFASPKKLTEIKELATNNQESQVTYSNPSPEDLLDYYLKIKGVFEYSELTDSEMVVLPEDRSQSEGWAARLSELSAKAVPILMKLQEQSRHAASEYREPPFLTIPVAAKEFFVPTISVVKQGVAYSLDYEDLNTHELKHDIWASRVLPGETYSAAIQHELSATLGYGGNYQVIPMKTLLDQVPDNSGNLINRYGIQIKLLDELDTNTQVMEHGLVLTAPQQ